MEKKNTQGKKTVLLGNFSFIQNVKPFLVYLEKKFDISKCDTFIYNLNNSDKFFITFKFEIDTSEKVNFKELFPYAIPVHKKGEAYYTINALNKLIEEKSDIESGNIDHKSIEIDWSEYQNKMILLENDELVIHDIMRIF